MSEENNENQKVTKRDITEEKCKQHPTESAIFLCKKHESMICGRCLHSGHLPCGKLVVDLLHETVTIDVEKVKTMKSALNELNDEILLLHDESKNKKIGSKNNAEKCVQECMELGNKIKQRVDEMTSDIRDGITKTHDENVRKHARIAETCDGKTKWCDNEKSKIDEFVDNNMAGYLYLMCRHFDKEVSDVRSHLKEVKHKQTFNEFYFKQNKVVLKCVFEDLEEVCELQKDTTGSDDGNVNGVVVSNADINKTRRELAALFNQAKQDLDNTELARQKLSNELKQVNQDLAHSEKSRKTNGQELHKAKQDIEKSEQTRRELAALFNQAKQDLDNTELARQKLSNELKQVNQDLAHSEKSRKTNGQELHKAKQDIEKSEQMLLDTETVLTQTSDELGRVQMERAKLQKQFLHIQQYLNWTQPTGTFEIKTETHPSIEMVFTFPDGIQTRHHPSHGKPYKGGTFVGNLDGGKEGMALCMMLKAAFKGGQMFAVGINGNVVLNGISLYKDRTCKRYGLPTPLAYIEYKEKLKAELAAKGITEANIDQTGTLEETFTIDGLSSLEAEFGVFNELTVDLYVRQ
ncbi:uncharacterized protein LOC128221813 [Mya arenaria]|uniref:uncharacterized protein LOC128221813 n=1 Tax=Mya arenaria TaxID=6604 RepID=UPI0022E6666B|nr:uncharacterized protein LOC128221813 [Mya arenaria]